MHSDEQVSLGSKKTLWTGRVISGFAVVFLLFDGGIHVLRLPIAVEGTTQVGYPASLVGPIGVIELVCLLAYVIPSTSVFGAILLTGYLGGAIATHLRIGSPLLLFTLFPIYVALLVWGGLFLRDPRLRELIPVRR